MTNFWQDKRVVVTGGAGFLGSHLRDALQPLGCQLYAPTHRVHDLRYASACVSMLAEARAILGGDIDILFNLAANVGGIGYNQNHPYSLYYDNIQIGTNLINTSLHLVKKFIQLGTVCAYPKFARPPFREEMLWDGYPEETNAPYGLAKKMAMVQLQAARAEFGFNGVYVLPTNLYGPRDEFDPGRSHVIPALIRKVVEARDSGIEEIEVWGSGNASRDFLYVADAVKALLLIAEKYNSPEPINIGSGDEIRIASLLYQIIDIVGYEVRYRWNTNNPDGQPRRGLNINRAKYALGWQPETPLKEGLRQTVAWYEKELTKTPEMVTSNA